MSDSNAFSDLKVAIVHEWFVDYSGSERAVEQILNIFPQADLFAQVEFLPDNLRGFIQNKNVTTSFVQKLPGAKKHYRSYLPLMPLAVEQFDLSEYDLIISSNHAVSKGVITGPDQLHISYVYSPIRYVWDLTHQYLKESGLSSGLKGWLAKYLLHRMRKWDVRTANGVDQFVAISEFIRRRIEKVYRRPAEVVYPPVDVDSLMLCRNKADYYLAASRMVPYKRMSLIVEAFSAMPERQLIVIGDGPELKKIRKIAGPNVKLLGYQPFDVLHEHLRRARAFVFAAEEDFGILPVEAQACGTPVIAYGKGGCLETVSDGRTGVFFDAQTVESLQEAVERFESIEQSFDPEAIRAHATLFSVDRFRREFSDFVARALEQHTSGKRLSGPSGPIGWLRGVEAEMAAEEEPEAIGA